MKHLIDLEYILKEYGEDHLIDAIHRHASQIGANEVVLMIEAHWQAEKEQLSKAQFGESND